jgi:hypothetical protein
MKTLNLYRITPPPPNHVTCSYIAAESMGRALELAGEEKKVLSIRWIGQVAVEK